MTYREDSLAMKTDRHRFSTFWPFFWPAEMIRMHTFSKITSRKSTRRMTDVGYCDSSGKESFWSHG